MYEEKPAVLPCVSARGCREASSVEVSPVSDRGAVGHRMDGSNDPAWYPAASLSA